MTSQEPLAWIFFDLDGTLWDHESASHRAIMAVCERYGLSPMNFLSAFKEANLQAWEQLASWEIDLPTMRIRRFENAMTQSACGCSSVDAAELSEYYLENYLGKKSVIEGAEQAIREASEWGRVAVVTNGFHDTQDIKVSQLDGVRDLIEFIQCPEDAEAFKSEEKFYQVALERAEGADPQSVLMVGDSWTEDVLVPRSLGFHTAWIRNRRPAPEEGGETLMIDSVRELSSSLDSLKVSPSPGSD